ncbi:MAG: hypothetical protein ACM3S2_04345 [Ignavibacteriales bacterium]
MNALEIKIKEINAILELLLVALDRLNDENFGSVMAELEENIRKMNSLRDELKENYDIGVLGKYEPELNSLTKQLENKFDNIINEIKTEQNKISLELKNIQNKKKLVNYNR